MVRCISLKQAAQQAGSTSALRTSAPNTKLEVLSGGVVIFETRLLLGYACNPISLTAIIGNETQANLYKAYLLARLATVIMDAATGFRLNADPCQAPPQQHLPASIRIIVDGRMAGIL